MQNVAEQQDSKSTYKLKRGLKARHLNMIAMGGAIGTGIFLALGATIKQAGPGGALVAYGCIGVMVYFLMTSLGEMATYMPDSGSFGTYATKFVDPALGFALGWNYWYNWAITVAAEMVAGALIMKYWFPNVPAVIWSVCFLALIVGLNLLSAKAYGESEFWFAGIKVLTVIVFLIVGIATIAGIFNGKPVGLKNFTVGEAPFVGGFKSIFLVFLIAGFSFQGTELVGIAAGESEDPGKTIPKAINTIFWRILLFYIGTIFVVGALIPYMNAGVDTSPFTLVFQRAGIAGAASLMNAIILTSVLSAGNSGMYASSRMLYSMAKDKKAPVWLARVNSRGVPVNSLILTTIVASACFLTGLYAETTVYVWLVAASGLAGFVAWLGIALCHYRFRKAYTAQKRDFSKLKYKAKLFPLGPIIALILCIIVILGQGITYFQASKIDWSGVVSSYIGLPLFAGLWLWYKKRYHTDVVKLEDVDFDSIEKNMKL
ncbi:amino acid permease [Clostridium luticellarii]|jgi:lysine-specific permease|uniref:Lysine-specific permease n=1 Tax=Clostridium luticellarii TaxID=1691940 RepID=A0A2T0BDM5_9CLOT|nr:amino acid permease [Clostridium luticellarii]MCI1945115.1 amino acid permease [Clostridium luticellarii]MCI1968608.1 amino acid permease [Clostridium luticellarii]MCI1995912.1 amino acid permease [Clostridium luticellarii]MCI2040987.1 amino acid permease [Clostridium luticellarii]PRR81974.1 Lysine-specific permease [Clostridium luticellarii]